MEHEARARVAVISLHTSPLDQPGSGDSGGMNVYVREVARGLGERGVAVDVFTRCAGRPVPEVEQIAPHTRILQVRAGPCVPVEKHLLPDLVPEFVRGILGNGHRSYDLVHAHYWLSGWAGRAAQASWRVPLVASFHTLGKVKNMALAAGEAPEPAVRLHGEHSVIRDADRLLVPTISEAAHVVDLYRARPDRIRVVTPGVDIDRFRPRTRDEELAALGLDGMRVVLFVGRLQPHKGPDLAIRAVAEAIRQDPVATRRLLLLIVGGPSARGEREVGRLRGVARAEGIADRVRFSAPWPHHELPALYSAAEAVLVPSSSESFGLVALEASACGTPVIAAAVGGLRVVVDHGRTGFLVPGRDPRDFGRRLLQVLREPATAHRLGRGAVARAAGFRWDRTTDELLSVYGEVVPGLAEEAGGELLVAP